MWCGQALTDVRWIWPEWNRRKLVGGHSLTECTSKAARWKRPTNGKLGGHGVTDE